MPAKDSGKDIGANSLSRLSKEAAGDRSADQVVDPQAVENVSGQPKSAQQTRIAFTHPAALDRTLWQRVPCLTTNPPTAV